MYEFPFVWSDPKDAERHWVQRAVDGRAPEVLAPLELDVRARWASTFERAAFMAGWAWRSPRIMEVNGRQYWHYPQREDAPPADPLREHVGKSFERLGAQLAEWGQTYLDAVTFPEMREGNRTLAAVEPDAFSAGELAAHLVEALDWIERGWTLHWARPRTDPGMRFTELYKEVTGDGSRENARLLCSYEPNKMTEAVDGLVGLARIAQRHPALKEWLETREPQAVVAELGALESVGGGGEFVRELHSLLDPERQGLRCGASWGVEQNQCLPGWRETPKLVIDLVQKYLPLDLDALERARAEAIARRDARVAEIRESITDEAKRERFDFWFAAGKQAVRAQEDHNYLIDSATMSLAHRAISACGRRLAGAGLIECAEDVWWLREHQVVAALRQVEAGAEGGGWGQLVAAHKALFEWQRTLTPPVAAVVLEVGSPFMHVMCVCREYGVPGIVNAKGALDKLKDGQRVTVDGEKGWVLLAD